MVENRRGSVRNESARQAILHATSAELAERGYDKLSLDRVAAAAGVGKQTIYRWYPSKSAVVAEAMREGRLASEPAIPDSGDVDADITLWLASFAAVLESPESAGLLRATIAATAEDDVVASYYDEQVAITRAAVTARLGISIRAGHLRPDAPTNAAMEALIGTVLFRVLHRQPLDDDDIRAVVSLLLDGMR